MPKFLRDRSPLAGVVMLALVGSVQPARAGIFQLGTWGGSLIGRAEVSHLEASQAGSHSTFDSALTEERFTLRNEGSYVLDPRILNLSVAGTFGLEQEQYHSDDFDSSRNGTLTGYDLFAAVLPDHPLAIDLFANREEGFLPNALASESKSETELHGAIVKAAWLYIPSTLTFRQNRQAQTTRIGESVSRFDNTENTVSYQGRRGWIDSEMAAHYDFEDSNDKFFSFRNYRSHDGRLDYSLDFGPELNRRWDSRLRYFVRSAPSTSFDYTTASVDEFLNLRHTENLRSRYRYSFIDSKTTGGSQRTHTAAANATHQLYNNLKTDVGVDGLIQQFDQGERDIARSLLAFDYQKRIAWNGLVRVGLGGGYQYEDDRFESGASSIPRELHTAATPVAVPITLDNPFVITTDPSRPITIEKTAQGPLPPGCAPPSPGDLLNLVEGRDYTVRTIGRITEIVPIPCIGTTPGINPGDTIAVTYAFAVPASLAFTTSQWHLDVSVDFGWIRPYFNHEQFDQTLRSGHDRQFLDNQLSDALGLELRHDAERLHASLRTEVRRYRSQRIKFEDFRSTQFGLVSLRPNLSVSLTGEESQTNYQDPSRRTRTFSGRGLLTYAFARQNLASRLFADAAVGTQVLEDSLFETQRTTEALVNLRWMWNKLEVSPTLGFYDIERGSSSSTEVRFILYTERRF